MKRAVFAVVLAAACGAQSRTGHELVREEPPPGVVDAGVAAPEVVEEPESSGLYTAEQAVADALSGPLTYIGTGKWNGIYRSVSCAYRNQRVIVVNVYCTVKEARAFRVDVFSPRRGRTRIYAEGKVAISTIQRDQYFTFKAETEPTPGPAARLPPFSLAMSFAELQAYEDARYESFSPGCFGGVEIGRPQGGCLGELAPRAGEWAAQNEAFLRQPPADWYRLVHELRARAASDGK